MASIGTLIVITPIFCGRLLKVTFLNLAQNFFDYHDCKVKDLGKKIWIQPPLSTRTWFLLFLLFLLLVHALVAGAEAYYDMLFIYFSTDIYRETESWPLHHKIAA